MNAMKPKAKSRQVLRKPPDIPSLIISQSDQDKALINDEISKLIDVKKIYQKENKESDNNKLNLGNLFLLGQAQKKFSKKKINADILNLEYKDKNEIADHESFSKTKELRKSA